MKRSNRCPNRAVMGTLGGAALLLAGCSSTTDPPPPALSVVGISQEVQTLLTLVQLSDAFNALGNLGNPTIAPVMGPAVPAPSRVPSKQDGTDAQVGLSALSFRLASPRLAPAGAATLAMSIASAALLSAPLGVTCVLAETGWAGGQDLFGPVPQTETFFELYETSGPGFPAFPPTPLAGNAFVSVRPGIQDPPSDIDVTTFVQQSGMRILEATTQGTVSGPNSFDVRVEAGTLTDGTNALGFALDAQSDARQTSLDFGSLSISESLSLDLVADAWNVSITALCATCNSNNVSFVFSTTRDQPFTIISGDAFVDGTNVAQLGGSLASPTATVRDGSGLSAAEAGELAGVLLGVSIVTSELAGLVEFESCVGSGSAQFCGGS